MLQINKIYCMDCLEGFKQIPDGSVDLIITDPPYGTMKGAELDGWNGIKTEWDTALKPKKIFKDCERVLKESGILILFSQEPYTNKLIINAHGNLPFDYRMIWLKDHFANALIAHKAPVNYFEDIIVFSKTYDTLGLNPLRKYFKKVIDYIGLNLKQINNKLGHRKAEHSFYVTPKKALLGEIGQKIDHATRFGSMQFGLCTEETYKELIDIFEIDRMEGFMDFAKIKEMNITGQKTFNLSEREKYKSNVLKYKKDYEGLHPTQKPIALLRDLVKTYSNEDDVVLDFTIGSGTTAVACKQLNRKFIGFELEKKYVDIANKRLKQTPKSLFDKKKWF